MSSPRHMAALRASWRAIDLQGTSVLAYSMQAARRTQTLGPDTAEQAAHVQRLHVEQTGGRLFRSPGWDALVGVLSVRNVLSASDIDAVVMVGHREPLDPAALIDTQAFVRPTMSAGRTELVVRPAADGLAVPFEPGAVLYTSCEPFPPCLSAALWARVDRGVYAADRHDAARGGFDDLVFYELFARDRALCSTEVVGVVVQQAVAPFDAWLANEARVSH